MTPVLFPTGDKITTAPDPEIQPEHSGVNEEDRLVLFGFGLFETILVTERGACFLSRHYERMKKGATLLGLEMPSFDGWSRILEQYLHGISTPDRPFALRITLSGGAPGQAIAPRLLFRVRSIHYTVEQYRKGLTLTVLPSYRNESSPLCQVKSANYLENLLAKESAAAKGFDEGLWCNTRGKLAEGTLSNLFLVRNNKLLTPAVTCGCLPGTRRALVLELANTLNLPWEEGSYDLQDLAEASEVFLTNSLMGIMPVRQVDGLGFPVAPEGDLHSFTRRLALALTNISTFPQ